MDIDGANGPRFTLRSLPLPAKLVVTAFLLAVGLGYAGAMMQLHFKHASAGNLIPGTSDVVARFSGVRPPWEKEEPAAAPKSAEQIGAARGVGRRDPEPRKEPEKPAGTLIAAAKIKSIVNARCVGCHGPDGEKSEIPLTRYAEIAKLLDPNPDKNKFLNAIKSDNEDNFNKENMAQAFTQKSNVTIGNEELEWKDFVKQHADKEKKVRAERETERLALKAWLEAGAPEDAYDKDAFPLPAALAARPRTAEGFVMVPESQAGSAAANAAKKRKNPKDCQISVESLTQSTHAHLLSFAMLWALTGMVFAFTSYPLWMRCGLAPAVLLAQVVDVSFWWLARLPDVGPYFAVGIMGTGALVGLGLSAQIVLSLFNMYGGKGKAVLLVLLLAGAGAGGLVYAKYIQPHVAAEAKG